MVTEFQGSKRLVSTVAQNTWRNVEHRPSSKHVNAEALSRIPCKHCGLLELPAAENVLTVFQAIRFNGGYTSSMNGEVYVFVIKRCSNISIHSTNLGC